MEMNILYFLQSLHNPTLDNIITVIFNDIVGAKGEIWVILGMILLVVPKTRKMGLTVLASYLIAYFIGDGILKDLIARPRPCMVDETVELLVKRPTSFSCPSVHSMLAFASATAIFMCNRKAGAVTFVFATLVGLSRMYFFVHYPTDVLFGTVLGILIGFIVGKLSENLVEKRKY